MRTLWIGCALCGLRWARRDVHSVPEDQCMEAVYGGEERRWSVSEPISTAYTQEQMLDRARGWVRTNVETKEQRFIVLGILVDFITDHFPKESKDTPADSKSP